MKYVAVCDTPPKSHPNLTNLIYTAANNVCIPLESVEVLLVDNWTDIQHVQSVLNQLQRLWPEVVGCLFLTSPGWNAILSICELPVFVERGGFRALLKLEGFDNSALVLKVDNFRTDLSAISEYIKWLKLEVEYNVSRFYYSNTTYSGS